LVSWDRGATGVTTGYELSITTGTSGLRETLKGQYKEVGSELFIPPRGVFIAQVKAVGLSGSDFSKEVTKITLAPDAGVLQSAKFIPAEDVAIVPPDITDLSVRMTNEVTAQVQFGEVIDPSSEFFKVVIRYSETATSWGATTFVAEFPARTQSYMIPYRPGVYYAKLRDIRTNAQSTNAAQVSALDISDISRLLIKSQLFDGSLLTTGTIRENLRATADADSTFSGVHDAQVKKRNNKLILGQSISSATQVRGSYTQNGTAITITPSFGYKQFDFVNLSISGAARLDSFNSPFVVASANDTSFTVTSGTSRSITTAENVFISPAVKEGTYFFNNQVDMGSKYEVVLTAIAKNETADVRGITNVQLYFRTSDTAPGTDNVGDENQTSSDLIVYEDNDTMLTESNATDFTEWQPFTAKFATGRVFQFKAVLSTEIPSIAPEISELGVDVELLERVEVSDEKQTVSTLAALNNSHYYINSFYQTPSLSASFVDPSQVNSGDILQVSAERFFAYVPSTGTYPVVQAGEAFEVKALSSANAFLVRKYRYTATGYGKKLPANPT
jgi:hypothetical protein